MSPLNREEAVSRGGLPWRRSGARWWVIVLVLGLVLAGCGGIGSEDGEPLTMEAWCAAQLADRCVEALIFLHWQPDQEACVVAVTDLTTPLFELCQSVNPQATGVPVTTNPAPGQIADEERERRVFIEEELPLLDARIAEFVGRTNPADHMTVGVVFAEPMMVPDMEAFVDELGGTWLSAWRTDFICGPALAGQPQPNRFAVSDGVERAAAARQAADESPVPVTGRFLLQAGWAQLEHAARAIREPGVLVEAVEVLLPVERLPNLENEPKVGTIRIAATPEEAGDLTDPPLPACRP